MIARILATWFGIGYAPVAPGTVATIAGILIAYGLRDFPFVYAGAVIACVGIGIWACQQVERELGEKDPGCVVIDEVGGVLIALWGLPISWPVAICGFFLFRAFDMFKIYPINRIEALPGGWGIMLDDVMAGVYTRLVLGVAMWWAGM